MPPENSNADTGSTPKANAPMGRDMGAGRSSMVADVITWMASAPESDLVDFFNKAMEQFGPGKTAADAPDASKKNMASIAMKGDAKSARVASMKEAFEVVVKDDVNGIFEGELSEEARAQILTVFEAAVTGAIEEEKIRLNEEKDAAITEELETIRESLKEDVENYLTFAANKWLEENRIEVEKGLRNELTEKFILGLKGLFKESFIEVPEDKVDLVKDLTLQVESLTVSLNEAVSKNAEMLKELHEQKVAEIFVEHLDGLSEQQKERFKTMTSNLNEENLDSYKKNLTTIKNTYFKPATIIEQAEIVGVTTLEEEEQVNKVPQSTLLEAATKLLTKTSRQ